MARARTLEIPSIVTFSTVFGLLALMGMPRRALAEAPLTGSGRLRGDPVPVPTGLPRLRSPTQPKAHATPGVIFVNFDGAQLQQGPDDSRANTTQIANLVGPFAPYGEGAKREAVMQALLTDWAAYDITVTDVRPASGDYTMNMTGPTNPFDGQVLGIAPLDCNDSQTHNNITFAFHSADDPFSAAAQATTVSQEVAHSYGLEHVNEPGDIMNPYNVGGDASFIDACISIVPVSGQGIVCGGQHATHCPGGTAQNAHLELLDLFGAAPPDTIAPTVVITSPNDGDVFEAGASFEITAEASDDVGVQSVQLFSNGAGLPADADEPFGWPVEDIAEGEYALYVVARDAAGNETASETITVMVAAAPPEDDEEGDGDDAGGSSGGGLPGGDEGGEDPEGDDEVGRGDSGGADSVGFGDEPQGEGGGCSVIRRRGDRWMLFGVFGVFGAFGLFGRRRHGS